MTTRSNSGYYERLGIKPLINGMSWVTVVGGSIMPDTVLRAMNEASRSFVDLHELNRRAGEVIARLTGAEAGLVTAGSAAGMMLEAAACITGTDPAKVEQLPQTDGLRNEIVIHKAHLVSYDHNFRTAGAKLVEIGRPGAVHEWQMEAAINENTAAVAYVFGPRQSGVIPLARGAEIAHERGVPVIVDAAAMLPPVENLSKYLEQGADMVSFSGGKGLRGPQSTGVLAGRYDLIEAAYMNAAPNSGIGRSAKVCKEEIVGLVAALELFVDTDFQAAQAVWTAKAELIVSELTDIPGVKAEVVRARPELDDSRYTIDRAVIWVDGVREGLTGEQLVAQLAEGEPSIRLNGPEYGGGINIYPVNLLDGEEDIVADRIRQILTEGS